jgi:ABC-type transport system involved in multi-copper enzyme maturation permease subunit
MGTLVVNTFFMALGVFAALLYVAHKFEAGDKSVLVALYFIVLEFVIVTALALLFSSFSSPLLSAILAFALFIIGTFAEDLRGFAAMSEGGLRIVTTIAAYLTPNFAAMNVISQAAHGQAIPGSLVAYNTIYALLYAGAALAGAVLIFERRNLK